MEVARVASKDCRFGATLAFLPTLAGTGVLPAAVNCHGLGVDDASPCLPAAS